MFKYLGAEDMKIVLGSLEAVDYAVGAMVI